MQNNTITELILAALVRAHESAREAEILARFGDRFRLSEKIDYVLNHAADPFKAARAFGLDGDDLADEDVTDSRKRALAPLLEDFDLCLIGDTIRFQRDCVYLEDAGEWADADDCVRVHVRRNGWEWRHQDDGSFFFCNWGDRYYCSDAFTCVEIDGQNVCFEVNSGEIYYWESDGEYHTEPEPDEDDLGLTGYHCGHRGPIVSGEAVAIELEVAVRSPSGSFGDSVRAVADAAEKDGSLPDNGAEIIFGSCHMDNIGAKVRSVLAVLEDYDCVGHLGMNAGFGCHINVSRSGWKITNACLARLLLLVGQNQTFWEGLAQRTETSWAYYRGKTTGEAVQRAKGEMGQKYEALAIRGDDRLEFRLFRSTCRPERLLKNVEACAAAIRFCRSLENHREATLDGFRSFIASHAATYPNLVSFISEKSL